MSSQQIPQAKLHLLTDGSYAVLDPLSAFLSEINKENIPPEANHKKSPPLRREEAFHVSQTTTQCDKH
jgi:hypothetical protein